MASMSGLPAETLDQICRNLTRKDVVNFRLACRQFAAIGVRYMLPSFPLAFYPKCFERLEKVSKHREIRNYVKSITFQTDQLPLLQSFKDFKKRVCSAPRLPVNWPSSPPVGASAREERYHERECRRAFIEACQVPQKELEEGWRHYQDLYRLQGDFLRFGYADSNWYYSAVLARLPQLDTIRVHIRKNLPDKDELSVTHIWKDSLVDPCPDRNMPGSRLGIDQIMKLLRCAFTTGRALKVFTAGLVSWRFFDEASRWHNMNFLRAALKSLHELQFEVACGYLDEDRNGVATQDSQNGWQLCTLILETGCVRKFLEAAPKLEKIRLSFVERYSGDYAITLSNVFGDKIWFNLRSLKLRGIKATELELLDTLKRHTNTLKDLELASINLEGPNCKWQSVFLQIRDIVDLKHAVLAEKLYSRDFILHLDVQKAEFRKTRADSVAGLLCRSYLLRYKNLVLRSSMQRQLLRDILGELYAE